MKDLPIEILSLILYPFYPTFTPTKPWSNRSRISPQLRSQAFDQYSQSLAICAQLRLLNHAFYYAITPHMHSLLIIPAKASLQRRRCRATKYHPQMIRTIFFNGIFESGLSPERKREVQLRLKKVLRRCTNLSCIRVHLVEYPPWLSDAKMTKALFQKLPTNALRSLELWNPGSQILAAMIEGLGKEAVSGLKALTIHSLNANTVYHLAEEGFSFQGLERLHIALVPSSCEPEPFLDFMTSILGVGGDEAVAVSPESDPVGEATHAEHPWHNTGNVHRTGQLHELTISEGQIFPNMSTTANLYRRLLSIGNIHRSLTTLRLRLRPPRPQHALGISLPEFNAFPGRILSFCPLVTRFHFLTWCPVSFLFNIPDRILELGVRIAEHPLSTSIMTLPYHARRSQGQREEALFPSTTLHSLDPLIEVVSTPAHRKKLERLYIEWGSGDRNIDAEEILKGVCDEAGVEFYCFVDW